MQKTLKLPCHGLHGFFFLLFGLRTRYCILFYSLCVNVGGGRRAGARPKHNQARQHEPAQTQSGRRRKFGVGGRPKHNQAGRTNRPNTGVAGRKNIGPLRNLAKEQFYICKSVRFQRKPKTKKATVFWKPIQYYRVTKV